MMDGIKYSSTWQILPEEPTGPIMLKHCVYKFMQIVGFVGCISPIVCILRRNYLPSSNYICRCSKSSMQECHYFNIINKENNRPNKAAVNRKRVEKMHSKWQMPKSKNPFLEQNFPAAL